MYTTLKKRKPKILVADDITANVELLTAYLEGNGYEVVPSYNGEEALEKFYIEKPDLVITDVMMPKKTGYEFCNAIKANENTRLVPVVMITALTDLDDKLKGIEAGADDFLQKPFNRLELLTRVRTLIKMKKLNDRLESSESTLVALANTVEAKDPYTEGHTERVGNFSALFGKVLGFDEENQEILRKGGILHDIGKIGIRDDVLKKPGRFTPEEMEEMKKHPLIGEKICRPLKTAAGLLNIIAYHHERIDGKGYPHGLTKSEIPVEAHIVAISDVYDACTTTRPYRVGMSVEKAVEILRMGSNSQWETDLVETFIRMVEENIKLEKDMNQNVAASTSKISTPAT
jgi:putative two-component system response regulator